MLDSGFGDMRDASGQAKTTSVMDIAEQRFAWLLKQRGYGFWREDELAWNSLPTSIQPMHTEGPLASLST